MASGADRLVDALERAGVRVVFGLPGVHNLAAWEALRHSSIRLIGVRHEQAAVYAADGYARATGQLGVALVTTGPGAANTMGATGEAWASRSPVLVIATDIATSLKRDGVVGGALHEPIDQRAMFEPVTKATLTWPDVEAAIATALAAPRRPVFLEIPTDLLSEDAEPPRPRLVPDAGPLPDGVQPLTADRPLIVAGSGALDAGDAVAQLAKQLGAPVVTTYSSRGLLADHPLLLGLPLHVPEAGGLWEEADVVVAIGTDLDGMSTMNWRLPQPPRVVAVNVDSDDADKNYRVDVVIEGDARGCAALAPEGDARAPWADIGAIRRSAFERLRGEFPEELAFLDHFAAAVPGDVVVVADMCIPGYWLAALHQPPAPRRFQYPMGWGTLGYAFPAAIGAAFEAPALAVCGDGGFLFACGELATVAQERLPLTTLIVDDGGYGMLRFDQRNSGNEPFGVDLHTPDFAALAESFGIRAQTIDGLEETFRDALAEHLADPSPSVLVARAALTPPPTTSPRWHRRTGPPAWAA